MTRADTPMEGVYRRIERDAVAANVAAGSPFNNACVPHGDLTAVDLGVRCPFCRRGDHNACERPLWQRNDEIVHCCCCADELACGLGLNGLSCTYPPHVSGPHSWEDRLPRYRPVGEGS